MRTVQALLLAGVAAAGLALAAPGFAQGTHANQHVLTVRSPSGELAEVYYYGDTPPRVLFEGRSFAPAANLFAPDPAFEDMDRIAAHMNAQMEAMLRQAEAMAGAAPPQQVQQIAGGAGAAGFCMQSVQVTSLAGQAPRVERRSYGDCAGGAAAPSRAPAEAHASGNADKT